MSGVPPLIPTPSPGEAMRPFAGVLLLYFLCVVGCGGGSGTVPPPAYDPDALAKAAIEQCDKNRNGTLEGSELDGCPALKVKLTFEAIDKNKDKAVSADELADRFRSYRATGVSVTSVACTVRLNGQPLDGATVTFTPEAFLAGVIKGGSGKSDPDGGVALAGEAGGGLPFGMYRITVSKKTEAGAETIPAKYNTATALGREVSPDRGGTTINLDLTSP